MNTNKINIAEILKDCPIGTKLYSPLFGEVIFDGIEEAWDCDNQELKNIVVITETTDSESFSEYGVYFSFSYYADSECMLFPSKDQRDWNKFKLNKPKFDPKILQPFDKVLVRNYSTIYWNCDFFSRMDDSTSNHEFVTISSAYKFCIPYNEETKHLIGTTEEAPKYYRYWED